MEGEQEQHHQIYCDGREGASLTDFSQLPSWQYPWLVAYNPHVKKNNENKEDDIGQIFSKISPGFRKNQQQHYHCQFPELHGRRIEGSFYGWLILSKLLEWSEDDLDVFELCLWNPVTRELINLPPLKLEYHPQEGEDDDDYESDNQEEELSDLDNENNHQEEEKQSDDDDHQPEDEDNEDDSFGDEFVLCLLTSPPSDPDSTLLLIRYSKPNIIFYPLSTSRKQQWTELSYQNELNSISNIDRRVGITTIFNCNGNVYAATTSHKLIRVDMDSLINRSVVNLLPFVNVPHCGLHVADSYLTAASCNELFALRLCFTNIKREVVQYIKLFKLNFSTMRWEMLRNSKGRAFFLVLGHYSQIVCVDTKSKTKSCIYIIDPDGGGVFLYTMEDKIMSLTSTRCPDVPPKWWQCHSPTWIMPQNRYCYCLIL